MFILHVSLPKKITISKISFFFSLIFLGNKLANTHSKATTTTTKKKKMIPTKCFKPKWVRLYLQLQLQLSNPDLLQNQFLSNNQTQISRNTTKPRKPINLTIKLISNKVNLNLQTHKFSWETNTKNLDRLNFERDKMNH